MNDGDREASAKEVNRPPTRLALPRLPRNVVALGVVSLLMGVSSQMTHSLLPLFLVSVIGASAVSVGVIEDIAEATNSIARVFSGTLSDWLGRRKPLVVLGYGLAALSKPLFPLAGDVATVLAARFIDRTGKGIRDAPRDALLADELPPSPSCSRPGPCRKLRQGVNRRDSVRTSARGCAERSSGVRLFHVACLSSGRLYPSNTVRPTPSTTRTSTGMPLRTLSVTTQKSSNCCRQRS